KLDVKEIHGYNNERGLKLIKLSAIPPSNGKGASTRVAAKQSETERKPAAQSKAKVAAKQ
ncbi:MAG TPA: hypothetical protein VE421_02505, partial [Burkholderiaceae bacterium]|nr:hypothetical protein [Burkholderiaceae bacterium]